MNGASLRRFRDIVDAELMAATGKYGEQFDCQSRWSLAHQLISILFWLTCPYVVLAVPKLIQVRDSNLFQSSSVSVVRAASN